MYRRLFRCSALRVSRVAACRSSGSTGGALAIGALAIGALPVVLAGQPDPERAARAGALAIGALATGALATGALPVGYAARRETPTLPTLPVAALNSGAFRGA